LKTLKTQWVAYAFKFAVGIHKRLWLYWLRMRKKSFTDYLTPVSVLLAIVKTLIDIFRPGH